MDPCNRPLGEPQPLGIVVRGAIDHLYLDEMVQVPVVVGMLAAKAAVNFHNYYYTTPIYYDTGNNPYERGRFGIFGVLDHCLG